LFVSIPNQIGIIKKLIFFNIIQKFIFYLTPSNSFLNQKEKKIRKTRQDNNETCFFFVITFIIQ